MRLVRPRRARPMQLVRSETFRCMHCVRDPFPFTIDQTPPSPWPSLFVFVFGRWLTFRIIAIDVPGKWKWAKESVCKWTKMNSGLFQRSKMTIPDNFSFNQNHLGPFQVPLTKLEKVSDLVILRVWKSYLEKAANISKVQLMVRTLFQKLGALVETN